MSRKTFYNTSMEVKRLKLSTQDDTGGITQTPITVFTAPCRIKQLNASEIGVGGKDGVVSTHRIYCNKLDVRNKDEIIIRKSVYDVNSINTESNGLGSLEVEVTLRK